MAQGGCDPTVNSGVPERCNRQEAPQTAKDVEERIRCLMTKGMMSQ